MKPLSEIATSALDEITDGKFAKLPTLAITGLLDDFQYSWMKRFKTSFKLDVLDVARRMCNECNKSTFKATQCKSIKDIRKAFDSYINKWHKDDDRLILSLKFDGEKINAEWVEMKKYLASKNIN
jgi:hypothetical protein